MHTSIIDLVVVLGGCRGVGCYYIRGARVVCDDTNSDVCDNYLLAEVDAPPQKVARGSLALDRFLADLPVTMRTTIAATKKKG